MSDELSELSITHYSLFPLEKRDLQDQWWVSSIRTTFRDPRAIAASDKITGDE